MIKRIIEQALRKRFVRLQGEGELHQADVYRCISCGGIVTWNMIRENRACCGSRIRPADVKFKESIRLLLWKI